VTGRILVTGGSGLVGSHVIEALRARGEQVRALVRGGSRAAVQALGAEPVVGDVTDRETWRRAAAGGVRGIVHAAALVAPRATFAEFERVNVGATQLAIEFARAEGVRLVHVSSVAVYGRSEAYAAGPGAVTEDFPFAPIPERDFYARTKRLAEALVRAEAEHGGFSAAAIRPNVVYGERDRLFTPRVIETVRRRVIPGVGPGTNHLSCVYAGNVAAAIVAALDAPLPAPFRAYNVTRDADPALTQREYLEAFAEASGVRIRRVRVPIGFARAGAWIWNRWLRLRDPARYGGLGGAAVWFLIGENPFDTERARRELGWVPPYDTRAAIQRTVAGFATAG
jgi:nucleoside-diphosphate-sugar epimerase